jgi:transcriptional regulator with XRE-family HTH domain
MVGQRIAALRKAQGLTQLRLAHRTGIALNTISRLERGENENPELNTLLAIAAALSVPVGELLAEPVNGKEAAG